MNQVRVLITSDDRYNDYKKGDVGYVHGYIRGGDNVPYVVVIIETKIVMVPFHSIEVLLLVLYLLICLSVLVMCRCSKKIQPNIQHAKTQ